MSNRCLGYLASTCCIGVSTRLCLCKPVATPRQLSFNFISICELWYLTILDGPFYIGRFLVLPPFTLRDKKLILHRRKTEHLKLDTILRRNFAKEMFQNFAAKLSLLNYFPGKRLILGPFSKKLLLNESTALPGFRQFPCSLPSAYQH